MEFRTISIVANEKPGNSRLWLSLDEWLLVISRELWVDTNAVKTGEREGFLGREKPYIARTTSSGNRLNCARLDSAYCSFDFVHLLVSDIIVRYIKYIILSFTVETRFFLLNFLRKVLLMRITSRVQSLCLVLPEWAKPILRIRKPTTGMVSG